MIINKLDYYLNRFKYTELDLNVISEYFRRDGVIEFLFDKFEARYVDYKLKQFFYEKGVSEVTAIDGFILVFQFLYIIPNLIFIFIKRPNMLVFIDFFEINKVTSFNKKVEGDYFIYQLSMKSNSQL